MISSGFKSSVVISIPITNQAIGPPNRIVPPGAPRGEEGLGFFMRSAYTIASARSGMSEPESNRSFRSRDDAKPRFYAVHMGSRVKGPGEPVRAARAKW